MSYFSYDRDELRCEGQSLSSLAERFGTPLYVYSKAALLDQLHAFKNAFRAEGISEVQNVFAFAVKANSNLNILHLMASEGFGGDVVSGGELLRCLKAGMDPTKIVFSGVGKTQDELLLAAKSKILSINVESLFELRALCHLAETQNIHFAISLRLNFDIHAATADKIKTGALDSKFGIPVAELSDVTSLVQSSAGRLKLQGLACHVGSQILDLKPLQNACQLMVQTAETLRQQGFPIAMIDMGGGLGIRYREEVPPQITAYAAMIAEQLKGKGFKLVLEPGRLLIGNVGAMITRVLGLKTNPVKNFIVVDAAMNDLPRHALYGAYHDIIPVQDPGEQESGNKLFDVVGPICETGDILGRDRRLGTIQEGDLLSVMSAGAYCASMASNYNSRPIAAEVLLDRNEITLIRARQTMEELWAKEIIAWK